MSFLSTRPRFTATQPGTQADRSTANNSCPTCATPTLMAQATQRGSISLELRIRSQTPEPGSWEVPPLPSSIGTLTLSDRHCSTAFALPRDTQRSLCGKSSTGTAATRLCALAQRTANASTTRWHMTSTQRPAQEAGLIPQKENAGFLQPRRASKGLPQRASLDRRPRWRAGGETVHGLWWISHRTPRDTNLDLAQRISSSGQAEDWSEPWPDQDGEDEDDTTTTPCPAATEPPRSDIRHLRSVFRPSAVPLTASSARTGSNRPTASRASFDSSARQCLTGSNAPPRLLASALVAVCRAPVFLFFDGGRPLG